MSTTHEFTAEEISDLLGDLDRRLRDRGVAASIFVVGGAAIAVAGIREGRSTDDVDALTHDDTVLEEAAALAQERGLPVDWLNPRARMWMPPLPHGVLDPPAEPGLRVTYADEGFFLATKLLAQRGHRDAEDVVSLATRLGLGRASAEELEAHLRTYYTDAGALELIVDDGDPEREIPLLARDAARLLDRAAAARPPDPPTRD